MGTIREEMRAHDALADRGIGTQMRSLQDSRRPRKKLLNERPTSSRIKPPALA